VADSLATAPREYAWIARMWIRASLAYPASFWILTVSSALITLLDFVGIGLMFATIDDLAGFELWEIAPLDGMLTRPVPLLVQVCADRFALRRLGRITQAVVVLGWGAAHVDWTVPRLLVAAVMLVSASAIFFALFVGISCIQFWTHDASEFANAFTYGGNTLTQYPLTIFPGEVVKSLTFVLPIAFVNWYPCLYLLGREDPFGMPGWFAVAPPFVAAVLLALASLAWRTGVRRYTSTGS